MYVGVEQSQDPSRSFVINIWHDTIIIIEISISPTMLPYDETLSFQIRNISLKQSFQYLNTQFQSWMDNLV